MGSGIAQVAASSAYDVMIQDIEDRFINKGMSIIEKSLSKRWYARVTMGGRADEASIIILGTIRTICQRFGNRFLRLQGLRFCLMITHRTYRKFWYCHWNTIC